MAEPPKKPRVNLSDAGALEKGRRGCWCSRAAAGVLGWLRLLDESIGFPK